MLMRDDSNALPCVVIIQRMQSSDLLLMPVAAGRDGYNMTSRRQRIVCVTQDFTSTASESTQISVLKDSIM